MVDLSPQTIKKLFERQMIDFTRNNLLPKEELFDYQFSGRWLE